MEHLRLEIHGMMCDHCVATVRRALQALPGVQVRQVLMGSAELDYDALEATEREIMDAVDDEGYESSRG